MGNKIIRRRESAVSAPGSQQDPAEDEKTTPKAGADVTAAQQTVPADDLDVALGQQVAETPCLPNEECVCVPEPMQEACVKVDFETLPVSENAQVQDEENDPFSSASPSLDLSTPLSFPQPTITPPYQTPIPEEEFADVPAAEGTSDGTGAAVSSTLDPDPASEAGDAGNLETGTDENSEESLSKCLKELSLMGNDPDLIDQTPINIGVSAELVCGSEDL
ncbi:uncharacterized protein si:ch211-127m7.2 isoform X1 [Phyllopteryx taeniolatus]|uniref:uncharacterized protein si:ch211-127m7.2 isoform X1 n=1 Tax=Phyllopteryx taeniolatus TaxID=161469 RepID=UPI002AD31D1D|nr:uncharacterized protein si:ch211-127m7.2 isoform X1 [Phyllopteryx taeniolatus]XP_061629613.1 uncharacterized protein si:ch211-127m7.2 isoform X1 [Phyllopteryx taeniolatus]